MAKILHVNVNGKIATYCQRDGDIVCDNADYQIKFSFDGEWGAVAKTARFVWNGHHQDVPISGDTCDVPIIRNATELQVGAYAGDLQTTTAAVIKCRPSCRSGETQPQPEWTQENIDQALEAATRAEAAARQATEAAAQIEATLAEYVDEVAALIGGEAIVEP